MSQSIFDDIIGNYRATRSVNMDNGLHLIPEQGNTWEGVRGVLTYRFGEINISTVEAEGRFCLAATVKGQDYGEPWIMWIPKGGKKDSWRGCCRLSEFQGFKPTTKGKTQ